MTRARPILSVLAACGACLSLAAGARGASIPNLDELRESVASKVCLVRPENELGIPLGYATGFTMGSGKFVVTCLATLNQPGVSKVRIEFGDGTTAVSRAFGMAHPDLGLAVIGLEGQLPDRGGLAILPELPPVGAEGASVATFGWLWGEKLDVALGRLEKEMTAADLAAELGVEAPPGDARFVRLVGGALGGASGAPVVSADGGLVGVFVDMQKAGASPVVVPAPVLRQALMAATPALKPLGELPAAAWPVQVQRILGEPVHPAVVARLVRALKMRIRCNTCNGTGTVKVKKFSHYVTFASTRRAVYKMVDEPCPDCHGERVLYADGQYDLFCNVAEQGTRLRFSPDLSEAARKAVRSNVAEVLESLAEVGPNFRRAVAEAGAALMGGAGSTARGTMLYAQVREAWDGPDGRYVMLAPYEATTHLIAVRMAGETAAALPWSYGQWVVIAGRLEGPFQLYSRSVVLMRPLAWAPGPMLGGAPPPQPSPQTYASRPGPRPPRESGPDAVPPEAPPATGPTTTTPPAPGPGLQPDDVKFFGL